MTVVGAILVSFESVQKTETFTRGRSAALDELRFTMNRLTKEIRQASDFTVAPTADSMQFTTYVSGQETTVTYSIVGDDLIRQLGSGNPKILQTNLVDPSLFAYAPDTTHPELVTISLSVEPSNLPDTVVTIDSEVRLRNLGGAQ